MRQHLSAALLFAWLGTLPLSADEPAASVAEATPLPDRQDCPPPKFPAYADSGTPRAGGVDAFDTSSWRTAWGLAGIRFIPAGPKEAPNGEEYHPNFSIDLDFNIWVWPSQGLYLFADARLWGEKSENNVTNARDGAVATSKREFDLTGGVAWNYWDNFEARAFGYTWNNLNRGTDPVRPTGFDDGFGLENRYYISREYEKLGQTGFDVARATFVSIGYYPSKNMVGNDGRQFDPGLFLRAYLTCDIWKLPCYAFGDVTYIAESSFEAKLLLFDVGLAARPLPFCRQCEFRLGVENTADFEVRNVQNLWYASIRYVF
jgi:hypothetical protein